MPMSGKIVRLYRLVPMGLLLVVLQNCGFSGEAPGSADGTLSVQREGNPRSQQATFAGSAVPEPTGIVVPRATAVPAPSTFATNAGQPETQATVSASRPAVSATTPAPTIKLSGTGEGYSDPFPLEPSLALFQIRHAHDSPLTIFLLDDRDTHLAVLAQADVAVNGTRVYGITAKGLIFCM